MSETCRLCQFKLGAEEDDDFEREICGSCITRPEARRLGLNVPPAEKKPGAALKRPSRDFTAAEKDLIKKVHGYMPAQQLLQILNERLVCDLGPDAVRYTMDLLYAEIGDAAAATPSGGHNWASLRKLLSKASRSGVLDTINEQVINDFAVVFSLNQKQVLVLKDIVLQAMEEPA